MAGHFRRQPAEAGEDALVAADLVEREVGHDQAAEHEQGHLHDVGQRDRLQPAVELVEQGEAAEREQGDVLVHAGDLVHRDRAEPDDRGQVHEDVESEPEDGHDDRQDPGRTAARGIAASCRSCSSGRSAGNICRRSAASAPPSIRRRRWPGRSRSPSPTCRRSARRRCSPRSATRRSPTRAATSTRGNSRTCPWRGPPFRG